MVSQGRKTMHAEEEGGNKLGVGEGRFKEGKVKKGEITH